MEVFQPEAIVVCGGADSLSGDRLGCFNLSLEGHAGCMEFLAKFGVPMLILGGGRHTLAACMSAKRSYLRTQLYCCDLRIALGMSQSLLTVAFTLTLAVQTNANAACTGQCEHLQIQILSSSRGPGHCSLNLVCWGFCFRQRCVRAFNKPSGSAAV